jgi:hypothetical protein
MDEEQLTGFSGYRTSPSSEKEARVKVEEYIKFVRSEKRDIFITVETLLIDELIPLHRINKKYLQQELMPVYCKMEALPTIIVEGYPSRPVIKPNSVKDYIDQLNRFLVVDGNHRVFAAKYLLGLKEINAFVLRCEGITFTGSIGMNNMRIGELEEEMLCMTTRGTTFADI